MRYPSYSYCIFNLFYLVTTCPINHDVSEITMQIVGGHLQTMWTVFWVFLTPPPPLWTNMDILGTPLPVHVDFSMTPPPRFFSKKKFKLPIYWNFKIQTYYKLFVEYLTHPLLANS